MKIVAKVACVAIFCAASVNAQQGRITGTVYDSLRTRAPLANATVVLIERSQYATTDSRGRFHIDNVPDGHYTIGFTHPVLDSLDLVSPIVEVEVAAGRRTTIDLFTPNPTAAYARICPGKNDVETGAVIGHVHDVDDQTPLANAVVMTDWTEFTIIAGHAAGHRVRATGKTDRRGLYVMCGVPTTVPLDVHAEIAGYSAGPSQLLMNDRLIGRLDFAVSRHDTAARVLVVSDSSAIAAQPPGTASLQGHVRGSNGRPLRDAVVRVIDTPRLTRTDSAGAFHLDRIPAGTRTIDVRRIGLVPITVSMDFPTNIRRDTTLAFSRDVQELKAVAVIGRRGISTAMELDGFERRRKQGLGAFVTAQEIAGHSFPDIVAILQGMRGIHIQYRGTGKPGDPVIPVPYMLGMGSFGSGAYCVPSFFLDRMPFDVNSGSDFRDLSSMLPPVWIKGIEIYSSPGSTPAEYDRSGSTGCGSIVIWTR